MLPSILFLSAVFVGMAGVSPGGVAMSIHRLHRRAVTDGEPSTSSRTSDPGKPFSSAVPSSSVVLEMVKQGDEHAIQLSESAVTVYNPSKLLPPSSQLFAKDMKENQPAARILFNQSSYANIVDSPSIATLNMADKEPIGGTLDCRFEEQQLSPDWMNKLYATDEQQPSIKLAASLTFHLSTPKGIRQCYYTVWPKGIVGVWHENYIIPKTVQFGLEAVGKVVGWMAELDKHTKDIKISADMIFDMYLEDKAGLPITLSTSPDQLDQSLGGVYMPLLLDRNTGIRDNRVIRTVTEFFDVAFDSAKKYMSKDHKLGRITGLNLEDPSIQQPINAINTLKDLQPKAQAFIEWINQLLARIKW